MLCGIDSAIIIISVKYSAVDVRMIKLDAGVMSAGCGLQPSWRVGIWHGVQWFLADAETLAWRRAVDFRNGFLK